MTHYLVDGSAQREKIGCLGCLLIFLSHYVILLIHGHFVPGFVSPPRQAASLHVGIKLGHTHGRQCSGFLVFEFKGTCVVHSLISWLVPFAMRSLDGRTGARARTMELDRRARNPSQASLGAMDVVVSEV